MAHRTSPRGGLLERGPARPRNADRFSVRCLYFAGNVLTLTQLREPDIHKRVSDDSSRPASDCKDFCVWRL